MVLPKVPGRRSVNSNSKPSPPKASSSSSGAVAAKSPAGVSSSKSSSQIISLQKRRNVTTAGNIQLTSKATAEEGRKKTKSLQPAKSTPPVVDGDDDNSSSGSSSTSSSNYIDPSSNDLTLLTGALLLTADCMGTGILALPGDVQTLGQTFGIIFLIINLPINLYAGTILSRCALFVEENMLRNSTIATSDDYNDEFDDDDEITDDNDACAVEMKETDKANYKKNRRGYSSINEFNMSTESTDDDYLESKQPHHNHQHSDIATFDFVGLTSMLFDRRILSTTSDTTIISDEFVSDYHKSTDERRATQHQQQHRHHQHTITYKHPFTKVVLAIYYINLFLVLANYTLVMSHSVKAMAGDNICIPTAGFVASILMFGLSQVRTMANLGRSISAVSLVALFIVVVQCLYALREESSSENYDDKINVAKGQEDHIYSTDVETKLAKMSAVGSIGFAVGSQKLLLNIRQ